MEFTIHEAKTHFSRLVERAAAGEETVIGKAGKPVARLGPYKPLKPKRKPGSLKGNIKTRPDSTLRTKKSRSCFGETRLRFLLDTHVLPWCNRR
jgi:prevent-host-death family protein